MPSLPKNGGSKTLVTFSYHIDRDTLRKGRRREGRYLLRSNLTERDPGDLWEFYLKLVEVEAAFRTLSWSSLVIQNLNPISSSSSMS